jgi:hypothetical protein
VAGVPGARGAFKLRCAVMTRNHRRTRNVAPLTLSTPSVDWRSVFVCCRSLTAPLSRQTISVSYFLVGFSLDADRFFFLTLATYFLFVMLIAKSLFLSLAMPNHQVLMIAFGVLQNLWWYV